MISLDYRDKRPIYEQVTEKISHLIVCGVLEPHTKMPSVRSLALELSVNPNTIQRAYAQLEQDGYLYTVSGRGNFVTDEQDWKKGRLTETMNHLEKQLCEARDLGITREEIDTLLNRIYPIDSKKLGNEKGGERNDRA